MPTNPSFDAIDHVPPGPFLGRRDELAQLCHAVEETRHGRGARLWIVGPPGIGKTRLVAEIERYAAWRGVPVEHVGADLDPRAFPVGPRLVIVDPVERTRVANLEDWLGHTAERGILGLATAISRGYCVEANIPEAAQVEIQGLDGEDALRLLGAWLGTELEPVWARGVVRSTRGHPERMRQAAECFLRIRRRARSRGATPTPGRT